MHSHTSVFLFVPHLQIAWNPSLQLSEQMYRSTCSSDRNITGRCNDFGGLLRQQVLPQPLQALADWLGKEARILGPFHRICSCNTHILACALTISPGGRRLCKNHGSCYCSEKLTEEFFLRFSPPEQLHSDQGRNFESALIAEICKLLGIKKSALTLPSSVRRTG